MRNREEVEKARMKFRVFLWGERGRDMDGAILR